MIKIVAATVADNPSQKPMRRASLPQLRLLLAEEEIAGYEGGL